MELRRRCDKTRADSLTAACKIHVLYSIVDTVCWYDSTVKQWYGTSPRAQRTVTIMISVVDLARAGFSCHTIVELAPFLALAAACIHLIV